MKTVVMSPSSVYAGNLILVNRQHPYREEKTDHTLVPVCRESANVLMERKAVVMLSRIMNDIHGWSQIAAVSGWRSMQEQQEIYRQSLQENGIAFTKKFVAIPGCSEHQTGLAIDLGLRQPGIDFIRPDFPYSGICRMFREKAASFGFVERYPAGKEEVTGIAHEPWHFRYVGMPHAAIMAERGLTLEEYIVFLRRFSYGIKSYEYRKDGLDTAVSYLPAVSGTNTQINIDTEVSCSVSGNNVDGFIITEWREKSGNRKESWRA